MSKKVRFDTHLADPGTPGHLKEPWTPAQHIPRTDISIAMSALTAADSLTRLPGVGGHVGMTARDAVLHARMWWDRVGRHGMPDAVKVESEWVVGSPILNGMIWDRQDRLSRVRIVKFWYAHVGVPTIVEGRHAPA